MPDMSAILNPQQRHFNPYAENGGTILAIAGADFTVIAGDTRQSEGYSIQTRYAPKVFRLYVCQYTPQVPFSRVPFRTDRAVLAVNGFAADGNMFVKKVKQRLEVLSSASLILPLHSPFHSQVVSARSCKRHAFARDSASHPNNALCTTLLPILRLQHTRRH